MAAETESIFSSYRFVRELQYSWLEYFAWVQATLAGGSRIEVGKSMLGDLWSAAGRVRGRRRPFASPEIRVGTGHEEEDLERWEEAAFDWLQGDYNEIYRSGAYRDTVIGMIASEFQHQGFDLNRLKDLSLDDLDREMKARDHAGGLADLDWYLAEKGIKKNSVTASIWNRREGGRWLAIYDDRGRRAGRPYEIVRDMVRDIVAHATEEDVSIDELRQRLLYADSEEARGMFRKPDGSLDEAGYQRFFLVHLNRDMVRVAVTETAINFENGKLLSALQEGAVYQVFSW